MTKQDDFWTEIDSRLGENETLSHGGLPKPLRSAGSFVGLYPWQTLLISSLLMVVGSWLLFGKDLVIVAERILLIR